MNTDCIAMAHNAKGYDAQFLLQYLARQGVQLSENNLIMNGTKIIQLKACGVTVRDTLSYLTMSVENMPKTFGLKEKQKGVFPYLFDTRANRYYKGPWPDAKYYAPDQKKPDDRDKFFAWYELQKHKVFDMLKEKHAYCESDVIIVRESAMKFRDDFMEHNGSIDPFVEACTIASACNKEFRTHHLKPNTIGLMAAGGYYRRERHSVIAIKWLMWMMSKDENLKIQHALNGLEFQVDKYKVDGRCGNTVYEFNGCYYHGCPKCFPDDEVVVHLNSFKSMSEKYQDTLEKEELLKSKGYTVVTMWECDMKQILDNNSETKKYFKDCELKTRLDPRDGFYGGRTGPISLYKKVGVDDAEEEEEEEEEEEDAEIKEGDRIDYVDICSLYPWVNKYCKYPVGHPDIITENFKEMSADQKEEDRYFGFVKGILQPPDNLIHPVLPLRSSTGKLCFPLCRTCCTVKLSSKKKDNDDDDDDDPAECEHYSAKKRALYGTWCTEEVYKALEKGYKVVSLYEVWHWKESITGLFASYVDKHLKLKVENSGYPPDVKTDAEREKFIKDYYDVENVALDHNNIKHNAGKRELSKLMLNSLWGKFGQRTNLVKTVMVKNYMELWRILNDKRNIRKGVVELTKGMMLAKYESSSFELENMATNTNVVYAVFTTSHARLELYKYMEKLGDRVLYTDTDSLIYWTRPSVHTYMVPLGKYLGEMTDEINPKYGENARITEFVSIGAKAYALKIDKADGTPPEIQLKSKGITLNYAAGKQLTMNQMVKMAKDKTLSITIRSNNIRREKNHQLVTRTVTKTFRNTVNKRRVIPNSFKTCPHGYRNKKI